MDVGLHEAGHDEPAAQIQLFGLGGLGEKTRSIWPSGSESAYGQPPTTRAPRRKASTMSSSVPGLSSSPS